MPLRCHRALIKLALLSATTNGLPQFAISDEIIPFNVEKKYRVHWGGICAVMISITLGIFSSSMYAQNAAPLYMADAGLPDAPSQANPNQASPAQAAAPQSLSVESNAGITGTVLTANGSTISNARVTLSDSSTGFQRVAESDSNGRFTFPNLPAGSYKVMIAASSLTTFTSSEIILAAGEQREMSEVILPIATSHTDVQVHASSHQVAEAQVKLAEKQRILGILPNFYSSYIWDAAPLTPKLKFNLALRSTTDPVTFLVTGGIAGVEQAINTFPGYGPGPGGYGKRYGAAYADNVIGRMLGSALLPTLFHQDPRYFYKGTGSISSRALYAIRATVITRGDNGQSQPNYSHVLGNFAAVGISNLYRSPQDRSASLTIRNGFIITGANALGNLVREFLLRKMTLKVPDFEQGKP